MNPNKTKLEAIIRKEFNGNPLYPLAARQCLHWADAQREDILVTYLPDLEAVLRSAGKEAAAVEVATLQREMQARVTSALPTQ